MWERLRKDHLNWQEFIIKMQEVTLTLVRLEARIYSVFIFFTFSLSCCACSTPIYISLFEMWLVIYWSFNLKYTLLPLAMEFFLVSLHHKAIFFSSSKHLPVSARLFPSPLFEHLVNHCWRGVTARLGKEQSCWKWGSGLCQQGKIEGVVSSTDGSPPFLYIIFYLAGDIRTTPPTTFKKKVNARAVQKFPIN